MNHAPAHLDLFSGIGGFSLAAQWAGFRTVAHAELDPDASLVLAHHWPGTPNLGDVRTIGLDSALGRIDLLTGGVPCQPASLLGKRMGSADERWLWPDTLRILGDLRPRHCVFENPPALLSLESGNAFAAILGQMAALRYDVLWGVIPAAAVGAGHLRERLCLIAADTESRPQWSGLREAGEKNQIPRQRWGRSGDEDIPLAPSDTDDSGLEGHPRHVRQPARREDPPRPAPPRDLRGIVTGEDWWHETHTGIPVLAHGIPQKLAKAATRCTSNAIVPQVFHPILAALRSQF